MFKKFIFLEWKAFTRSAAFKFNLAMKIIFGVVAAFYTVLLFGLGVSAFYLLKKKGLEPLSTVNKYLIYWWVGDLLFRYFLQKLPIMRVKPLLTMPVKKGKIVSFLLAKSAASFFNIYQAFFFLPFTIVLMMNGYSVAGALAWHFAIVALVYANNYLNLLIDNLDRLFVGVLAVLLSFAALQYLGYLDITVYTAPVFQAFYKLPVVGLLMLLIPVLLYGYCHRYFKSILRTDEAVKAKVKEVKAENFTWLEKYGSMGTFLKNDIKLIKRNKRSRSTVVTSFFFLFYGLLIISNPDQRTPVWMLFSGLFISGGFLFTFGGLVPSWDSSYYPLMMSQNIKYKQYLSSKWWLMVIGTLLAVILASFYLFIGWQMYLAIIVGGIYNIGINGHIVLWGGAYVKTPIDLTSGKKAFGDKRAFKLQNFLIAIPKMALPLLIFYAIYKFYGVMAGYLAVAGLGIMGLAFRNIVFSIIERIYRKEKYATLAAYKQNN